jgi:hypothetical protein
VSCCMRCRWRTTTTSTVTISDSVIVVVVSCCMRCRWLLLLAIINQSFVLFTELCFCFCLFVCLFVFHGGSGGHYEQQWARSGCWCWSSRVEGRRRRRGLLIMRRKWRFFAGAE